MKFMSEFELHQLTRLFGTAVGVTWTGLFARPFPFACFCVCGARRAGEYSGQSCGTDVKLFNCIEEKERNPFHY